MEKSIRTNGVEFTEDVVQEKEGVNAALFTDHVVAGQAQGKGERSLLALRSLPSSVSAVQVQRHIVTMGTHRRIAAMKVVVE